MNLRIFTLIVLVCSVFTATTQNTALTKKEIQWQGFETWSTGQASKQVISFVDAHYPSDNDLPYLVEKFTKDANAIYQATVVNPEFQPVSGEEKKHLSGKNIPEKIAISSYISTERGVDYQTIQILPFVRKGDEVMKLIRFDLQREKQQAPQKAPASLHSYTESSVLASGKFVKVKVVESGIYKLTHEAIRNMGVDPANVRVFGYGGALLEQDFSKPKFDDLPEVTLYQGSDYILFYGQGITKWSYSSDKRMFTHTLNHYAKEGYYFITSDAGTGKKIQDETGTVPSDAETTLINEFVDYKVHEVEKINLGKTGKVFYGEEFTSKLSYDFPFSFPNLTSADIKVRIDVAAISTENSSFDLSLSNTTRSISVLRLGNDRYEIGKDANVVLSFPSTGTQNLTFNLKYNKANAASRGYLNYLTINARRKLQMTGSALFFRNTDNLDTSVYNKYQISGAGANVQVWDITDPINIKKIATNRTGDVIEFTASNDGVKEYVAIDPTAKAAFTLEPATVGTVANQNLHGLANADMVIITHPSFAAQAEKLAAAHREKDNLSVNIVTTEQVYNEFSSGTPDATAYRWVMKMFYDRAQQNPGAHTMPKYLLLFGRGTFDNRGLIPNSGDNLVLTYQADQSLHLVQSYVTDDYFGFLDNSEGTNLTSHMIDLGIGRFPTVTPQQAEDVVNKTIAYMKNDIKGNWKNQLTFLADDGDDSLHIGQADGIAQSLFATNPEYQFQKIYLDSYLQEISASGESYPLARKRLHSLINTGMFMLNFTGHAGPVGWTNEQILSTNDVTKMFNKKLPIWIAATCDFVLFDVKDISAGEFVMLNPVGGGIGIFSAARTVYAAQNERINRFFTIDLFEKKNGQYPRLGDAVRKAKNQISSEINKLTYVLLGDPALRLNYPDEYKVVTEKINGNNVQPTDTLRALSVNTVQGYITDMNGSKVTDFNGLVEITIYDKKQNITTLNNHNEPKGAFTYQDRPNILYSGKAQVSGGEFSFKFMMPRDIRYNFDTGRINYYANDTITGKEGQGYYEKFIVGGGSATHTDYETDGPTINMYLNTPSFTNGGKVNETPLFVAHIFDINGINTVGSGIGHDLRLVIDSDSYSSYTLNENFEAEPNSYQAGRVQIKLPEMSPGKHTLTFHAWDLLNNSSQATLEFEVVQGLEPIIFSVRNYPNPAKVETSFVVDHDRPEVILETKVEVFDLAGRLIFTKEQKSADNLKWDLKDSTGNRVRPGLYIYNISAKTTNSEFASKANKIVVLAQ